MITPEYVRMMAAYNMWQNNSLYREASAIGEAARREGRGAFFGSIYATLGHILWCDHIWMYRFGGWDKPKLDYVNSSSFADSFASDWDGLCAVRKQTDERLTSWADQLTDDDLAGDLTWFSGTSKNPITSRRAMVIVHMFNHQTHHRGQVHAMLTAAGAKPDDTDLPYMDIE